MNIHCNVIALNLNKGKPESCNILTNTNKWDSSQNGKGFREEHTPLQQLEHLPLNENMPKRLWMLLYEGSLIWTGFSLKTEQSWQQCSLVLSKKSMEKGE